MQFMRMQMFTFRVKSGKELHYSEIFSYPELLHIHDLFWQLMSIKLSQGQLRYKAESPRASTINMRS